MNPRKELAAEAAKWWRELIEDSIQKITTGQLPNPFEEYLPIMIPPQKVINKFERYLTGMIARELKKKQVIYLESDYGTVSGLIFWSANVSGISLHLFPQGYQMMISLNKGITIKQR